MKLQDIREKSVDELKGLVVDLKKELFNLRLQKSTNKLENPASIATTKRTIARVKTVLKEKEVELSLIEGYELGGAGAVDIAEKLVKLVEKKEIDQLREELARTKQELYNTKMDRDILKKSLALFGPSKPGKKRK